jgi:hypothetical protein
MKTIVGIAAITVLLAYTAAAAEPAEYSVKALPPSVVKTAPPAGDVDVDPALKEITVTFSKDMRTKRMWSICQISDDTFPKAAGPIRYRADNRTCVFPVRLEPGKTYVLWFNRGKFTSFHDTDDNPAVPYLLVFQTRQ